jgi:spore coat polysaccharide biosynthesis protein SpsF
MIGIILQARTGSTRLPRKSVADILGKPMLWHIIRRLKQCKNVEKIIVATTTSEADKKIVEIARQENVDSFAGSENDVLDRFYQAAKKFGLDIIIRITGDCPLIEPEIIDKMIEIFLQKKPDYLSNILKRTFPDGLDVEIFTFNTLERAWKEAKKPYEREHVTPHIHEHPEKFKLMNYEGERDLSGMRWCVDYKEDLEFIRKIYELLYKEGKIFHMKDVLSLLEKHPELLKRR